MANFYRTIEHMVKERIYALRHMSGARTGKKPSKQLLVVMIDGRMYHGGMTDRFRGIISAYAYCKQKGIGFRILYTSPFRLEDYLLPASYDWRLKDGEFSNCRKDSRILYYRGEHGKRLLRTRTRKQIHYYGNIDFLDFLNEKGGTDYKWGELFRELFEPSPLLAANLDKLKADIGGPYNAAVFRFQNLLGDFPEYRFKTLNDISERQKLMNACLDGVRNYISGEGKGKKLLVTSDSISFLEEAAKIENVFVIPGSIVHMDGGNIKSYSGDTYLKSFLDFFMISGADYVACIGTHNMYNTHFPDYAAKLRDIPFKRIYL